MTLFYLFGAPTLKIYSGSAFSIESNKLSEKFNKSSEFKCLGCLKQWRASVDRVLDTQTIPCAIFKNSKCKNAFAEILGFHFSKVHGFAIILQPQGKMQQQLDLVLLR